ncbi:unnamed protein product [Rotaria sordida]|uniref:Uncharacterized protein n=1 Tax=Rotaria sordida TaxID=392033 RepID=A0A819CAZ3_9BILA|nr:unnamed protein product [Rotaria sordida]
MDTAAKAPGNSTSFEIAIFCLTGVCLGVAGTVELDVSDSVVVKGGSRYGRGGAVSRKCIIYKSLAGLDLPTTRK